MSMRPIYPICEATCKEHYGKPVVIFLKDGGELSGVLSGFENGQLILNDDSMPGAGVSSRIGKKTTKSASKSRKGAKGARNGKSAEAATSAYPFGPYPYPYPVFNPFGRIVLDLALVALLFALI
jgi:small nuclear ribonucleoprotein (snRNP)-like protein